MTLQRKTFQAALVLFGSYAAIMPVLAQQQGIYAGQTADGSQIAIEVIKDGNGFDLFGATVAFLAQCKGDRRTVDHAWGFVFRDKHPIRDGKAKFDFHFENVDIASQMTFEGTEKVSGTVETRTASLARKGIEDAQYCVSPEQNFTATFSGDGAKLKPFSVRTVTVR